MIEYVYLVHLLTKDDDLLERYSEADTSIAADYLLNNVEQDAQTTLEILRMLGEKESEAYEKTFEFLSGVKYYYYSNPISNNKLINDVEEAIRLYKLRRIL